MSLTIYLANLDPGFAPGKTGIRRLEQFLQEQGILGERLPQSPVPYGQSYLSGPRAWSLFNEPDRPREELTFERLTLGLPDSPLFLPQTLRESFRLFCQACKAEIPAQLLTDELDRVFYLGGDYQSLHCPRCGTENPLHRLRSTVAMGLSRFFIEIAGSATQKLNGGLIARLDALAGQPLAVLFE